MKNPMARFVPVLVEPKYQGNIGSIARLARNFGMERLILINPPELEDEAKAYSMHGKNILESALRKDSLEEAASMFDYIVGTSGISDSAEKNYHRNPVDPERLARWTRSVSGTVGLAFGREDFGLFKEELDICDMLVTIPAEPEYPILNLSHSAGVIFYELFKDNRKISRRNARSIRGIEKETLLKHYDRLMEASGVPEHKRPIARTNFRRMISRAGMNYREYNTLMGTFSRAMNYKREKINGRKQR